MATKSVETLLNDIRLISAEHYELVEAVRAVVKQNVDPVTEDVKYGGILFASGVPFCGVFAYKEYVTVEFSKGAHIHDSLGHHLNKLAGGREISGLNAHE